MFPLRNFPYTDPLTLLLGYKILACPCYILEIERHSILKLLFLIVKVLNKLCFYHFYLVSSSVSLQHHVGTLPPAPALNNILTFLATPLILLMIVKLGLHA